MRRIRVPLLMFVLASLVGSAVQVTWSAFSTTTANPSNSFSAASSFVTCLASSPLWLSGMEHGASSISGAGVFTSGDVGTAATVDSTVARTGSYSLKIVKSNGSSGKVNRSDTSGLTDVTVRFAVRFQTLPAATVSEIFSFTLNTAGNLIFGYNQGTGKFTMKFSGAAGASSVNTVNAGQWYVIDLRVRTSANPHTIDWQIDGVAQTQSTNAVAADTLSNIRWGGSITTEAFTVYFDDMIYTTDGNDYPIGAGGIKSLVPNVTSTVSDASGFIDADDGSAITTADSSWSRIDERPVTSMTDYIKQTGNATGAYASYGFEDVASSGCINAVSGVATLRSSTTTANSAKTAIWEGGTERTIFSGDMSPGTGAQEYRSKIIAPATGSWDATKLSGTTGRLGYWNGTGGQPYWDGLMLEYDQVADASTAYENVVLSDSPAGYWRLGETTGNTATARSGTPNGTYTNSPVLGVSGQVGDSNLGMYVTGSNQINYGDNYDFAGTANFTFEFWVVLSSSTPNNARVFSKEGIGGYDLRASQSGGGYKLLFSRMDNGFTSDQTNPATILSAGTPYHVAITYDGSNIRTYYNGVLAGTTASTRSVGNDGTPLAFGSSNGGSNGIIGQLDELAIYTSPLSLVRIQAHYDAGKL